MLFWLFTINFAKLAVWKGEGPVKSFFRVSLFT